MKAQQNSEHINFLLSQCTNVFGKLTTPIIKRLVTVIKKPTERNWNNAYTIILNGGVGGRTLWQAVIAVDPTFPRSGPVHDLQGKCLEGWSRVPDSNTIVNAILHAITEASPDTERLPGVWARQMRVQ